jgi:ABC-type lipoprotein export system ATPase subunit
MQLLNQKIWNKYNLQFPVDQDKTFLIGENGSGKSHALLHLKTYFEEQGESVIYFPDDRFFLLEPKECYSMLRKSKNVRELVGMEKNFAAQYNINLDTLFLERHYEKYISSGILQLVNFYCTIESAPEKSIVLIDEPERNIDYIKRGTLVDTLFNFSNTKKIIVATHCPSITENHYSLMIDIKECIIKDKE